MTAPRFAPIVERPVRTERAIRNRREAERKAAKTEALRAYVERIKGENHERTS